MLKNADASEWALYGVIGLPKAFLSPTSLASHHALDTLLGGQMREESFCIGSYLRAYPTTFPSDAFFTLSRGIGISTKPLNSLHLFSFWVYTLSWQEPGVSVCNE